MSGGDPQPRGATLRELAGEIVGATIVGDPSTRVSDVRHDSRDVRPGDLFVARRGQRDDGARYVRDAAARGAAAVLCDHPVDAGVPCVVANDVELALALASSHVWAHPTWTLDVLGVTGTNGKTTTAWLVEHALRGWARARGCSARCRTATVTASGRRSTRPPRPTTSPGASA
ncbi:MAG: Mur ligase domain-containing protein [Polyangiales bacterium]